MTNFNQKIRNTNHAGLSYSRLDRPQTQEELDKYCDRVRTIAKFLRWEDEQLYKALNYKLWYSKQANDRLTDLEKQIEQRLNQVQESILEYKSTRPDHVVFQVISKRGEIKTIGITTESQMATELYDGLVFNTVNTKDSPFKSEERVGFILEKYQEKEIEKNKMLEKEKKMEETNLKQSSQSSVSRLKFSK